MASAMTTLSWRSGGIELTTRSERTFLSAGPCSIVMPSGRNARGFTGKLAIASLGFLGGTVAWGTSEEGDEGIGDEAAEEESSVI